MVLERQIRDRICSEHIFTTDRYTGGQTDRRTSEKELLEKLSERLAKVS